MLWDCFAAYCKEDNELELTVLLYQTISESLSTNEPKVTQQSQFKRAGAKNNFTAVRLHLILTQSLLGSRSVIRTNTNSKEPPGEGVIASDSC